MLEIKKKYFGFLKSMFRISIDFSDIILDIQKASRIFYVTSRLTMV